MQFLQPAHEEISTWHCGETPGAARIWQELDGLWHVSNDSIQAGTMTGPQLHRPCSAHQTPLTRPPKVRWSVFTILSCPVTKGHCGTTCGSKEAGNIDASHRTRLQAVTRILPFARGLSIHFCLPPVSQATQLLSNQSSWFSPFRRRWGSVPEVAETIQD